MTITQHPLHFSIPSPISPPLLFFFFLLLVILTIHFLFRHHLLPSPLPSIPHNPPSLLHPFGDLPALGTYNLRTRRVFTWLSLQCLQHSSPIIQLFLPSFSTTRPTLVIADLAVIEDIATKRMHEIDRADLMHTWFGVVAPRATIGLRTQSRAFKEQRKLWNVVQGQRFVEDVAARCFGETAAELVELWEGKVALAGEEMGRAFEAQEDVKMATLEGMWRMLVGTKLGLLRAKRERLGRDGAVEKEGGGTVRSARGAMPEFYGALKMLLMLMDRVAQGTSPQLYMWVFSFSGILAHFHKKKDRILDQHIALARQRINSEADGESCALDQVLQKHARLRQSAAENDELDDAALRDEILDLLITGHETTATTVSWALKYLADNPESQTRLRASLTSAFAHANYTEQPLCIRELMNTSLPYLDAFIAESLRLSNTGPVSFRQALVNCEIMGHSVPAGTPIILVTAGPSYDSPDMPSTQRRRWPKSPQQRHGKEHQKSAKFVSFDDEEGLSSPPLNIFAPERWLSNGKFVPDAVRMLPFSAGPRGCFGKRIAMLELRILIATLVMRFEFPQLAKDLSGYEAQDNLTSRPQACYVCPKVVT